MKAILYNGIIVATKNGEQWVPTDETYTEHDLNIFLVHGKVIDLDQKFGMKLFFAWMIIIFLCIGYSILRHFNIMP